MLTQLNTDNSGNVNFASYSTTDVKNFDTNIVFPKK
jgi:hypothetical protein